jgi:hypothetical protein
MPTVNEEITNNLDDAHRWGGGSGGTGSTELMSNSVLWAGYWTGGNDPVTSSPSTIRRDTGLRFRAVAVPAGTVPTAATLTVKTLNATTPTGVLIYGNDVDNGNAAWVATNSHANAPICATKTTANVAFPTGTGIKAIDVTAIVAEILARPGWASGNDMRLMFTWNLGNTNAGIQIEDLNMPGTDHAKLDITYAAGRLDPSRLDTSRLDRSRLDTARLDDSGD